MFATFVSDEQLILVKHDDVYHTMHALLQSVGKLYSNRNVMLVQICLEGHGTYLFVRFYEKGKILFKDSLSVPMMSLLFPYNKSRVRFPVKPKETILYIGYQQNLLDYKDAFFELQSWQVGDKAWHKTLSRKQLNI